ncbi:enoyl-CoA hydratase/isomerase family protein [Flavobacterium sp. CFBP9031]|uniref:enoyl-CoA hydratase/isomerase family protein n=1 Tax=Flavobacterium sp. CFBP9031 TaxID=3096538 RepID=UPI002A69892A|nr:enoyl-CoA hydratase/isomerase family protein [Flavobacterium sp. CFBP9031]MDY0986674.1 enoyl-CoA hydratase/isomerase family protein [Flavobacterium sp. CFBP9031]
MNTEKEIHNKPAQYQNYKLMEVELLHGVAYLTFNNPPINVLNAVLISELKEFAEKVALDNLVKVIVFQSSNPEFFIAHGDMNFVTDPASFMNLADSKGDPLLNPMQQLHERLRNLPQITIAKLSGFARGGGNELAMALDMRFAVSGKTWLAQPEVLMGIIPGGGGTQYLSKLAGRSRALEVILGAELHDSATAEKYGIINRAIPEEEIDSFVSTLATRMASLLPGVIDAAKNAVNAAFHNTNGITTESNMLGKVFGEPAAAARMIASMEKGAQTIEGERQLEKILNNI